MTGRGPGRNRQRRAERNMRARQNARRLRGNHVLAAVVSLVRRIAGHRAAALHRLLVKGHGVAFSELHQQQYAQRHDERCDLPKHHPGPLTKYPFRF